MIATGLFAEKENGGGLAPEDGAFKGGDGGLLGWNIAGSLAITLWSGGLAAIVVSSSRFKEKFFLFFNGLQTLSALSTPAIT